MDMKNNTKSIYEIIISTSENNMKLVSSVKTLSVITGLMKNIVGSMQILSWSFNKEVQDNVDKFKYLVVGLDRKNEESESSFKESYQMLLIALDLLTEQHEVGDVTKNIVDAIMRHKKITPKSIKSQG